MIYQREEPAALSFDGRTRGQVAIIQGPHRSLVIKPVQSQREAEIAAIAGQLGVGPQQYITVEGFLTEEFIPGKFFTELPPEQANSTTMYQIGRSLGNMLCRLHASQIYYNDSTLSDPNGRSHLLLSDGHCRLIDFGISLLLDRHPRLDAEEAYNFARTLPMFSLFTRMGGEAQGLAQLVGRYQRRLAATSVDEIMARDLRFTEEGLRMASRYLGNHIVDPFNRGFTETYG